MSGAGRLRNRLRRMKPDEVVAESRRARLVRKDGRLMCECPYACLAAYEPCEFEGKGFA